MRPCIVYFLEQFLVYQMYGGHNKIDRKSSKASNKCIGSMDCSLACLYWSDDRGTVVYMVHDDHASKRKPLHGACRSRAARSNLSGRNVFETTVSTHALSSKNKCGVAILK